MKEVPADAEVPSHQLMLRAGLIRQLMAGAYTFMPLGYRVIRKVSEIVREEMDRSGAVELFMPALQPQELFDRTGRNDAFGNVLFRLEAKRGDRNLQFALGPTHEEVITDLVSREIKTYKQLPVTLYQIQTKFRNEERPRFGVLRTSEFLMKDAYSFASSIEQLDASYDAMYQAYCRIFERCGLRYLPVEAESGAIGGDASHEFMVPADNGEDFVVTCPKCNYAANQERADTGRTTTSKCDGTLTIVHGIEVGHVFKLGTKYSEALDANFLDSEEKKHPIIMGCYGIGVSRVVASIVETCHDENGISWPTAVAPYTVELIPLNVKDEEVMTAANKIYDDLIAAGIDVLMDDRDQRPGFKFKDADLIGLPVRVVVGGKGLKEGIAEIKQRTDSEAARIPLAEAVDHVKTLI
ncbi:UNVERIFIED_CONTAM: hypothetical protein GTU68_012828 [Idotea baltica]|nr:hypothetical protein [Idotea baltica]